MDTLRLNISYRPIRICWAISVGDFDALRIAVRTNYALWGGRFNPIVAVEHSEEACAIVSRFRPDVILPVGKSEAITNFIKKYPHLISPFYHDQVLCGQGSEAFSQALDIHNLVHFYSSKNDWAVLKGKGAAIYKWDENDPLSDVLMMQLGQYPKVANKHIDYDAIFQAGLDAARIDIDPIAPLPTRVLELVNICYLSRYGLVPKQPYIPEHPGFYHGDASDFTDLLTFWNLRANHLPLVFIDKRCEHRFENIIALVKGHFHESVAATSLNRKQWCTIWHRQDVFDPEERSIPAIFGDGDFAYRDISRYSWEESLQVPPIYFSDATTVLAVVSDSPKPKVSFALGDRPFSSEGWFYRQLAVASIRSPVGFYARDDYTLSLPYLPEMNEFFARAIYYFYNRLRCEREGFGLIIDASASDISISPLATIDLFKKVFEFAGFTASVSSGGLIAKQLISQMGGLQGGRVFKIPGVRRLIKTYGPSASFTKRSAHRLIGGKDPENPNASFSDHEDLVIEYRAAGAKLSPEDVFRYLVNKRLFRIGADLKCPTCQLHNWYSVDDLRQSLVCQMCGEDFDATTQLVDGEWTYRRSGVLGAERNAQGAVPVALALQQLDVTIRSFFGLRSYSLSLDLKSAKGELQSKCEVDFAWLLPSQGQSRAVLIIGECKDKGSAPTRDKDGATINSVDIDNLRAVADAFPRERFEVYILLAKLCPFTTSEIEMAKSLNSEYRKRVILLTDRELDPYFVFDRTAKAFDVGRHPISAEDLATATDRIYFQR